MRVTSNSSADSSLYYIQQGRAKLDKLAELTASGQNINTPSEDPIATNILLGIADKIKASDQYKSNINKLQINMEIAGTALQGMYDSVETAKDLANSLVNGSSDANTLANAVSQLQSIKQEIVDMGNTKNGDTYIFGGANNTTAPFASATGDLTSASSTISNIDVTGLSVGMQVYGSGIPAGTTIVSIASPSITLSNAATTTASAAGLSFYAGDETTLKVGISESSTMKMSIPGNEVLTADTATNQSYGSTNILKAIDDLIAAVQNNDATGITAGAQALTAGATQINNAQNEIATRQIRLDSTETANTNTRNTLMTTVDSIQSVDYTVLGVELTQQQTAFNASLSATAKITQLSLLDYLS